MNNQIVIVIGGIIVLGILIVLSYQWHRTTPTTTPTYHIVVAKYKEDISWLFYMDPSKLHVYDKSGDKNSPFIPLENKGREGATFLGHIITHYDKIPEYLIIVQGDPYPHMKKEINHTNFQEHVNKLIGSKPKTYQPLFCEYWVEDTNFYQGLLMDQYYRHIFDTKVEKMYYAAGNQYIIPRQDILKRPKSFYQKLWRMSCKGDHYSFHDAHYTPKDFEPTEIMGWSLERIFPTILSDTPLHKNFLS